MIVLLRTILYLTVSLLLLFIACVHCKSAVVACLPETVTEKFPKTPERGDVFTIELFFLQETRIKTIKTRSKLLTDFKMLIFSKINFLY